MPAGEFTPQDGDTGPGDGAFFHRSVLVSGHFTKTSNSVNNTPASEQSWTRISVLTLTRVRDNQETLNTSTAKYESHLGPKYTAFQKPPFRDEKSKNIYQPVSIIFLWLWHASCSKCAFWQQQVQINVSQDKLTHSTVADGSFTALDVNSHMLSYQKVVKYIYDFVLP